MIRRAALLLAAAVIAGTGCGRYRDFTLPRPEGPVREISFRWEAGPVPVLTRGEPGAWDGVDALNPAIVRHGGKYWNFYSGFDGKTWHTGLAVSPDGVRWEKQGKVLSPDSGTWEGGYIAANGAVLMVGDEFLYWYQAGEPPRIGLARSSDGRHWRKTPSPVVGLGPRGSWDERGAADPYVIRAGGRFFMFYLGQDRARRQRLGVAVSGDGALWWKSRRNPVLEAGEYGAFDETGLGEPAVWSAGGSYWMLYTGRDRLERRRLGLARSRDGLEWRRVPNAVFAGEQAWNGQVICDPEIELTGEGVRVWFGGGDVAHPAERINGQIGRALLRANLAE